MKPITLTGDEIQMIRDGKISVETARLISAHNQNYKNVCGKKAK